MNILLFGVLALGLVCMIVGYVKGFIKIVVSLVATVVTLLLVTILSPTVGDVIIEYTALDEAIETKFSAMMFGDDIYLADEETTEVELPLSDQITIVESADIPDFLKEAVLDNNNSEIYNQLGVETFTDYIGSYLANWVIQVIAFIVTFFVVWIIVRVVVFSLDVIADLPVFNGINRWAGIVVGLGFTVIFVWIGFLGLTLAYSSEIGQQCYTWINESTLLTMMYDANPLMDMLL